MEKPRIHIGQKKMLDTTQGAMAYYNEELKQFQISYCSDALLQQTKYTREEFLNLYQENVFACFYYMDQESVVAQVNQARKEKRSMRAYVRLQHKDEEWHFCQINGWQGEETYELMLIGETPEFQLFYDVAKRTVDNIYVIDQETHTMLYVNEFNQTYSMDQGKKCYAFLYGKDAPCSSCPFQKDTKETEAFYEKNGHFYRTRCKESNWNGRKVWIKYIRDVSEEVKVKQEKERLEEYFQTVLDYLPDGVVVILQKEDGTMEPEYLSDGFAEMLELEREDVYETYRHNIVAFVHPEEQALVKECLRQNIEKKKERYEMQYRIRNKTGEYLWVKAMYTLIYSGDQVRIYIDFHDITVERYSQEKLRQQFQEQILQHHLTVTPTTLVLGHCNITQNRILEIDDHTNSDLLETFGNEREKFFTGLGTLIVDEKEREQFYSLYLNEPSIAAYQRGDNEVIFSCFVKLPKFPTGKYVKFKVNLVETPETHDITGILSVNDITEETMHHRMLHQLSLINYDLVADLDLVQKTFSVMDRQKVNQVKECYPYHFEEYSLEAIVPKQREQVAQMLDPEYMLHRLEKEPVYSFSYSIVGEEGNLLMKMITISALDLKLGRVCLARTDITDSVREHRGLLNMIAYTFELACFIDVKNESLTMHTRNTVLKNLPPLTLTNYTKMIQGFTQKYVNEQEQETIQQFSLEYMLKRLEESPNGYDFVFSFKKDNEQLEKQVNVLWGDHEHQTICLVRADVTEMLAEERKSKYKLEEALNNAKKANRVKSDFLSSMSHDIRTPMNAIMGMTTLALANIQNQEKTEQYLKKIVISSQHLLSLINDILDMSQIEQSKLQLNRSHLSMEDLVHDIEAIMKSQANDAKLNFDIVLQPLKHHRVIADPLRLKQILINLLGNAFKFTLEGGSVTLQIEEISAEKEGYARYRFMVKDTGIGMSQEFMKQLFQPFTRSTSVSKVEGTGLGLSITKGLVELMEGSIQVQSELYKGTTFFVELEYELPEEDPLITQSISENERVLRLKGKHFLIAEDNPLNSEILCELLSMEEATFTVTENGEEVVKEFIQADAGTYDAILMDIQMPVMNGLEATKAIRESNHEEASSIVIVAMTANAFAQDVQASLDVGMNAHVAKPVDMNVLCQTLMELL